MAAGVDRAPDPGADRPDRVGGTNDRADLLINWRKGTNSAQALVHSRMIAGYFFSHFSLNLAKASNAADSETGVYTGLRSFAIAAQSFPEAYLNELRSKCTIHGGLSETILR